MAKATKTDGDLPKKSSTEKISGPKVLSHGYTAVPNILMRAQSRLGINTTQFNIIVQLLSYWMRPDNPPFRSKKDLANRMGITPATVRINIKALEDAGLIEREQQITAHGDYGSNIYRLNGLVEKLKSLVPDFDDEREERRAAREKTETPNARSHARRKRKSG
ncbi:helix-turn-helix domain-containing protein [uncultured Tateyamaria sp.]|uniref:helix-turn-helix domain-containing protein n=1 Tax=uncultured Tateyamaria sp. TaxID=455651 RepID=UPI00262C56CB|nr:helix-turn-helix domain-containing protein [uncultured Tateyamaria sp.]